MKIIVSFYLLTLVITSFGQGRLKNGLSQDIEIGVNNAYLTYNMKGMDKRHSLELRVGTHMEKSLSKRFAIRLGMRGGFKPKTNYQIRSFIRPPLTYLSAIDESLNARHHYYLEMPMVFVFNERKFTAGIGIQVRHYLNTAEDNTFDFVSGQYEGGLHTTIGFRPVPELRVSAEAYFGISNFFSAYFGDHVTFSPVILTAKNNFVGLSLACRLDAFRPKITSPALPGSH